ncbi:hypothetical protein FOL47_004791 [Perkinsus chesapeaki]|uniref:Uncharacterized protein n=1 Tax=Perkinsus chesapeaki TaxID=330153 RepID=A0A7J6M0M3_PERCH|nr:hypothetical protein FOL47_004791 [Perkinsus chesapeaki]
MGQDTSAEGPGVGHYFGGDKHLPVQCKTSPAYSLGDRRINYHMNCKGYWWRPTPGANAYNVEDKRSFIKDPTFCVVEEPDLLGHWKATHLVYHRAEVVLNIATEKAVTNQRRAKVRDEHDFASLAPEQKSRFRSATCSVKHDEETSTARLNDYYVWMLDLLTNIRRTVTLNKLSNSQSYAFEPLPGKRMILKLMKAVIPTNENIGFVSHKPDIEALAKPRIMSGRVIVTEGRAKQDQYAVASREVKFHGSWSPQSLNYHLEFIDPHSSSTEGAAYLYTVSGTPLEKEYVVILERDMRFNVLRQTDSKFGEQYGWEMQAQGGSTSATALLIYFAQTAK